MVNNSLRARKLTAFRQRQLPLILLALPAVIYVIMFQYAPMFGVVMAFKDYNYVDGIFGSPWAGFKYFKYFFESVDSLKVLRNTMCYSMWFQVIQVICSSCVALMLYEVTSKKAINMYQTCTMLPFFISSVLVAYIVYALLSNKYGMLNQIITSLGGQPINWYAEPKYWPAILTITKLWSETGMNCLLYYGALMGIDPCLFEAAKIDGAGRLKCMWHISVPCLLPIISITTIMAVGHILGGSFGLFFQVPRDSGALYSTTDILATYIYRGLKAGNLSQNAAVGLFSSAVGMVLTLLCNAFVRKVSPKNAMF